MRRMLILAAALLAAGCAQSPERPAAEYTEVRRAAEAMAEATRKGDFDALVARMDPRIIEIYGSPELAISEYRRSYARMEANDIELVSIEVDEPTLLTHTDTRRLAVLPVKMVVETPDSVITTGAYMIGSAELGSSDWKFMNSSGISSRKALEAYFPGFPPAVTLPQTTREVQPRGADSGSG